MVSLALTGTQQRSTAVNGVFSGRSKSVLALEKLKYALILLVLALFFLKIPLMLSFDDDLGGKL